MFMCDRTCDLFKVGNFNIKRCLLFLVCIMLLVACGENDPIESRNRHPRQQEESHSEQSGSVPAVAKEDVAAYFRFDMSRDINVALGLVEAQKETLQINGKMIKITEAVVKRKDYQKGSFVLYVTGTVNGSPFNVKLLKLYLAIENTLYLCIKDKINNEKSYRLYSCFY